jgi:hypothetical protein
VRNRTRSVYCDRGVPPDGALSGAAGLASKVANIEKRMIVIVPLESFRASNHFGHCGDAPGGLWDQEKVLTSRPADATARSARRRALTRPILRASAVLPYANGLLACAGNLRATR